MADLNKIIDELSTLTVVEAAELSKQLEEKWGVTASTCCSRTSWWGSRTSRRRKNPNFHFSWHLQGIKKLM